MSSSRLPLRDLADKVRRAVMISMRLTGEKGYTIDPVTREKKAAVLYSHDEYDDAMHALNQLVLLVKAHRAEFIEGCLETGMPDDNAQDCLDDFERGALGA